MATGPGGVTERPRCHVPILLPIHGKPQFRECGEEATWLAQMHDTAKVLCERHVHPYRTTYAALTTLVPIP
jgi:hypothetical protein